MSVNLLLPMIDGNSKLPSFYEFLILSQIESTLIPTIRHIINTVIDRLQFNISALDYSEDGIIIIKTLIDSYYIYYWDATFVECIYGLCRISNNGNSAMSSSRFLSSKDRNYNVILKALFPSLLTISYKCFTYYMQSIPSIINNQENEIFNDSNHINTPNRTEQQIYYRKPLSQLRKLIIAILKLLNKGQVKVQIIMKIILHWFITKYIQLFPSVKMVLRLLSLFQQIRYLFQISPYYDLILLVTDVTVVRRNSLLKSITNRDVTNISDLLSDKSTSVSSSNSTSTTNWSSIFFLGLMALRITEHILHPRSNGQYNHSSSSSSKYFPPPPSPPEVGRGCIMPPNTDAPICPLCRNTRQQPAVSTGGYVFCFRCLLASLHEKAQCPITGIPCTESDIIRIFEEDRV